MLGLDNLQPSPKGSNNPMDAVQRLNGSGFIYIYIYINELKI